MADDGKQPLRWVSGPNTRADGSWQVTVADMAGKPQTRTFKVEARAQEYADGANERKSISPIGTEDGNDPLIIDIPDHDETGQDIGWYQTAGRVVLKAMLACADPVRREILRKDLAAISSVQKGVKAIVDQGKLEKRIAEVEGQLGEVRAKRRYGAGTRGTFRSNRARAGSSE
jgi:hypothetical protein